MYIAAFEACCAEYSCIYPRCQIGYIIGIGRFVVHAYAHLHGFWK